MQMNRPLLTLSPLYFAISAALTSPAWAAEAVTTQETLTIVGDWLQNVQEEQVFNHAGARTLVNSEDFSREGSSNIQDALRLVPGVFIPENSGNSESQMRIGVRGMTPRFSAHTNVLLDGIPLAVAPYGMPHLSIAPALLGNLDSIDVMRNGGSVRYGPQNVGGIINLNTKEIPEELTVSTRLKGAWWSDSGAGGLGQKNADLFVGNTNGDLGWALMYSTQQGDSYREHSDSDIDDLMFKYSYAVSDTGKLSGRLHYYDADNEMPGGLTQTEFDADPFQSARPLDRFKGYRKEAVLRYEDKLSTTQWFDITAYYTDSMREFTYLNLRNVINPSKGTTYYRKPRYYDTSAIEARYGQALELGGLTHEFSMGYRYLEENAREEQNTIAIDDTLTVIGAETALASKTVTGDTQAHALYLDDRIVWNNFEITPGVRYENIDLGVDKPNVAGYDSRSNDNSEWLPSLNVLYRVNDNLNLFANYNSSFGSVTFNALSKNENLSPEKAQVAELGLNLLQDDWHAEVTVFNIDFEDRLFSSYDQDSGKTLFFNAAESRHRGIELAAQWQLDTLYPGLSANASYTWLDAEFTKGVDSKNNSLVGKEMPFAPEHVATLGLSWDTQPWLFNASVYAQSGQFADVLNKTSADLADWENELGYKGSIPGYGFVNVRGQYSISPDGWVAVGVKNLFDKRYFTRDDTQLAGLFVGNPRQLYLETAFTF